MERLTKPPERTGARAPRHVGAEVGPPIGQVRRILNRQDEPKPALPSMKAPSANVHTVTASACRCFGFPVIMARRPQRGLVTIAGCSREA